ncbi:MAG: cytochrome c [Rhodospirillaceae bacterium]|nr:cytochrome c [Rhodospirillaceae bacterium]
MRFVQVAGMLFIGAGVFGAVGVAMAQQKGPTDIIKARQELMKGFGASFKIVNDQLKTEAPDKAAIAEAVKKIADTGKDVGSRFPAGTGAEAGIKTRAKPEIWSQAADFKASADTFVAASAKYLQVVSAGNMDAIKGEAKSLGDACGGCHKKFRVPEEAPK